VTLWKAKDEKEFIQGEVCGVGKLQKVDLSPNFQISTQKEKMKKKERKAQLKWMNSVTRA
jgi:hypothetical protein